MIPEDQKNTTTRWGDILQPSLFSSKGNAIKNNLILTRGQVEASEWTMPRFSIKVAFVDTNRCNIHTCESLSYETPEI